MSGVKPPQGRMFTSRATILPFSPMLGWSSVMRKNSKWMNRLLTPKLLTAARPAARVSSGRSLTM